MKTCNNDHMQPVEPAGKLGTEIASCNPSAVDTPLPQAFSRSGAFRHFVYSSNGAVLALVDNEGLSVVDVATNEQTYSFAQKGIIEVSMSPKGTYVCTWERQAKPDPATRQQHLNLLIHNVVTGEVIARHAQKAQGSWVPQWTDDEAVYGRLTTTGEVTFYPTTQAYNAGKPFSLRSAGIADYSLSPGSNPYVVVFIPESKSGNPAIVKMFSLGNSKAPVANKTFFKADKIKFIWNKIGTGVLVLTSTDVDSTGQSYYGENNLYYMSTTGNWDCRVALDKEGPIHDVAWAPNSKEFAVTYGFIPSKTALFSYKADPIFDFGTAPRNTLSFSPTGRVLAVGGFGNLPGDLDFWDMTKRVKLAAASSPNATHLSWSPDGRHLLTSTLSPRLRVDNGWKLWHYRGICVASHAVKELFQVAWRPTTGNGPNLDHWAKRDLSPAPQGLVGVAAPKPKALGGAYRPPSARNGPRTVPGAVFRAPSPPPSAGRGRQVPGMAPTPPPGANRPQQGGRGQPQPQQGARPGSTPSPVPGAVVDAAGAEKRVQALVKKLKQIQGLKQKLANGEKLDNAQIRKVESEKAVRTELSDLGATPNF
ncbi:hypothetical protein H9P43_000901 [Blastocladiella emersonii ATCC 22665]|nr:hypothetical protein H9P43_000901 [Blastocladiella emersonii ATCC 22665]